MKYVIVELQDMESQVANLVTAYASVNQAEQKYHEVLSAAAVSQVPVHSAIMLNSEGPYIKSEAYDHRQPDSQEE